MLVERRGLDRCPGTSGQGVLLGRAVTPPSRAFTHPCAHRRGFGPAAAAAAASTAAATARLMADVIIPTRGAHVQNLARRASPRLGRQSGGPDGAHIRSALPRRALLCQRGRKERNGFDAAGAKEKKGGSSASSSASGPNQQDPLPAEGWDPCGGCTLLCRDVVSFCEYSAHFSARLLVRPEESSLRGGHLLSEFIFFSLLRIRVCQVKCLFRSTGRYERAFAMHYRYKRFTQFLVSRWPKVEQRRILKCF